MKPLKALFLCLLFISYAEYSTAQTEEGIPYQAVLSSSQSTPSQQIEVRFGISTDRYLVYEEEHQTETSADGLFSLVIGQGQATVGSWDNLVWSDPLDLSVQIRIDGDWETFGSTRLQSVPKSFYALKAGSVDQMTL